MYSKPILLEIILKHEKPLTGVNLQYEAPNIPGFLAIEDPQIKRATKYISLDEIISFSVLNEEVCNILGSFPTEYIKVKNVSGTI